MSGLRERLRGAAALVVLGPTATGKSALAVELALRFDGEIVNLDSRQVYRHMQIGTAKPTPADRAAVVHHGLDLVDPDETWTLAQHQELAYEEVAAIHAAGRLPIVVAGTGLYLRAVLEGWTPPAVAPHPALRSRLYAEAERDGSARLHSRLAALDPVAAAGIMPTDRRRTIRALEVIEATGRPFSEQQRAEPPGLRTLHVGLTMERAELYARADARAESMLSAGLLGEIEALLARDYGWELASMRSIGYGEFAPYFEGSAVLEACVERLKLNTHKFIRGQYVWFRRYEGVRWLDASDGDTRDEAARIVEEWTASIAAGH